MIKIYKAQIAAVELFEKGNQRSQKFSGRVAALKKNFAGFAGEFKHNINLHQSPFSFLHLDMYI